MNVSRVCRSIEDSCCGIEIQDLFVGVNQNNSLLYSCELKHNWGLEYYLEICAVGKLLNMNEDVAYCKALTCVKVMEISSIGKCLFKTGCKWEVQFIWKYLYMKLQESRWGSIEFCDKMGNVSAGNVLLFRHIEREEWQDI